MQDSRYVIMLVKENSVGFWNSAENKWGSLFMATVYDKKDVDARSNRPMLGDWEELPYGINKDINVTINGYAVPSAQDVANAIVKALRSQGVTQ
jgi:hypothetical protein